MKKFLSGCRRWTGAESAWRNSFSGRAFLEVCFTFVRFCRNRLLWGFPTLKRCCFGVILVLKRFCLMILWWLFGRGFVFDFGLLMRQLRVLFLMQGQMSFQVVAQAPSQQDLAPWYDPAASAASTSWPVYPTESSLYLWHLWATAAPCTCHDSSTLCSRHLLSARHRWRPYSGSSARS